MSNEVRTQAEAALREIEASFAITSRRESPRVCGLRTTKYVTWNGQEAPIGDYVVRKMLALEQWRQRWEGRLAGWDITVSFHQDIDGDLRVIFHHEPTPAVEPEDEDSDGPWVYLDDPWKPDRLPVESSGSELQRIALYKPLPPDERWTLARIESVYPEQCNTVLTRLTRKQEAVAAAYLREGLSQAETAERCGMSNPVRVSEVVGRIRERFRSAGLPEPQPPLRRENTTRSDDEYDDLDIDTGKGPIRMLPADPKQRRRAERAALRRFRPTLEG
jgi:hypothetical protein